MFAVYAARLGLPDPLDGLRLGDLPAPRPRPGWSRVTVRAAALNHHDLWSLRGVGLTADRLPMILGTDAAGVDEDGNEVVVHPVVGLTGHGLAPGEARSILTEKYQGTFAEQVTVPTGNLVPKPPGLSFAEAACLPTAWLTAYRMLFTQARVRPGDSVLVQGSGGGVATAAIALARAAGLRVYATGRDPHRRARALALGATDVLEPGAPLPHPVDAVLETVGAATWSHSIHALRRGGTLVLSGATSGDHPTTTELTRIASHELTVRGSTVATVPELRALLAFLTTTRTHPTLDHTLPLSQAPRGFTRMTEGTHFGKIVFTL
ncbi:zinc-binding dehydrogenase [Streptomyces termitum]|uniref:zinc-binding dehydrogenase n=1 Tax=Streptomyces termitum TaxID=67368 RepID=UPI0033AF0217